MNSAYKLMLIVFLLNFQPGGFGCEPKQTPETVEQQTDQEEQEEDNALARLKPEAAKEKQAASSETAGPGREKGIEKTGEFTKKVSWIPDGKHRKNPRLSTAEVKAKHWIRGG